MSLTRKLAHNTITQIAGKVVSTLLGLVAIGIMTRYLGQEQFGWYVIAISFLQFVGILIDFGLIPVSAQMISRGKTEEEKETLLQNLLGFRFVSAVLFLAVTPLIALFFPYPTEVKIAISFMTISFLAISMNQIFTGYYQYALKMHIYSIGELVGRIILVGGLVVAQYSAWEFLPVMGIVTVSSVGFMTVLWFAARRYTRPRLAFDIAIWKTIMTTMWPIAIAILFNVIYLKGDIIILSLYVSESQVGVYGAAYRVVDILAQVAMIVMGLMLPILAAHWAANRKEAFAAQYQQAINAMMLIAFPMMVGTILLSTQIMKFVAGSGFAGSGQALRILSIAVFCVFLSAIFGHMAVAIDKQKKTIPVFIVNAILTLIGYVIFIPRFGVIGAAWMSVFSELFAGIFLWLTLRKYYEARASLGIVARIALASVVMGVVVYLLKNHVHVILTTAIAGVIYGLCLYLFKAISKEMIREIISPSQKNIT